MNMQKITTPDPTKPLYTYDSYLKDRAAGLENTSFGFVFFDTYFNDVDFVLDFVISPSLKRKMNREGFDGEILSKINNDFEKVMRRHIDKALQEYLLNNNGIIDAWPHHIFSKDFVEKTTYSEYDVEEREKEFETYETGRYSIVFDYFGTEFTQDSNNKKRHIRRAPGKCHRFDKYMLRDDFKKAKETVAKLEHDMQDAKRNPMQKFKRFIASLPAVFFVLCDILLIVGAIFGIDGLRETIGPVIPFYMTLSSVDGYSALHFLLMPFVGGILTVFLNGIFEPQVVEDVQSYKIQKKMYEDYINSDEYKRIKAEGPINEMNYNRQSAAWHKEWFDAIKAHSIEI